LTARSLTGAGWYFSASHRDPVRQEIHGHSYEVMCWWPAALGHDAMDLQEIVKRVLQAGFDHKTLPDDITRAEDIARAIGGLITDCVRVDVKRPSERLQCEVWL
jgi:6-pyruvoyl-tetrahydropterin synthase